MKPTLKIGKQTTEIQSEQNLVHHQPSVLQLNPSRSIQDDEPLEVAGPKVKDVLRMKREMGEDRDSTWLTQKISPPHTNN